MPEFISSTVKRAEYHSAVKELKLWFPDGRIYHYSNVPASIFEGLCKASSKGRYFNSHIVDRFSFKRGAIDRSYVD